MEINPVKGTHDIFGDEASDYQELEERCRYVADLFSYEEIRTPIIEHTPLFVRSVGESSDVVTKEMYTFLDKGERSLTLRPELTSGVMRSIVTNKLYANADLPLKYYYLGPCFRYERPQAGRYRQFNQFGVEAVGAPSYYLDAEVIALGHRTLTAFGFEKITILINSLGDEASRASYRTALKEYFAKYIDQMCADCQKRYETNPLRILDCKVKEDQKIIEGAPKMSDFLSEESKLYLKNVISALDDLGIEVKLDDKLVRGLDYYTGVVFEYYVDTKDAEDVGAVGGGGHYAHLLADVGGPDLEGVGLSFGEERLAYLWKSTVKELSIPNGPDYYLMAMSDDIIEKCFSLADVLRAAGFVIEMNYEVKSFKSLFKIAARKNAKFAVIIGEDEIDKDVVTVKNLQSQEQTTVNVSDIPSVFRNMLDEYMNACFSKKGH